MDDVTWWPFSLLAGAIFPLLGVLVLRRMLTWWVPLVSSPDPKWKPQYTGYLKLVGLPRYTILIERVTDKTGEKIRVIGEWPKEIWVEKTLLPKMDSRIVLYTDTHLYFFLENGHAVYRLKEEQDKLVGFLEKVSRPDTCEKACEV